MNFKLSNFYIGVIDFFAIILPGAVAFMAICYFNQDPINGFLIIHKTNTGVYDGFIFLLSSYLLGHFIGQGSAYLDKWVFGKLHKRETEEEKREAIAKIKPKKHEKKSAKERVEEIRKQKYGNVLEPEYVNSYQWSLFKLHKEQTAAALEVERYMADSKFFRSLFLLLLILAVVFILPISSKQNIYMAIACLLLAAFSMARYSKKYKKSTNTAYRYIIFFEDLNSKTGIPPVPEVKPE